MLLNKSVKDFLDDRDEYLGRPTIASVGGPMDYKELYSEGDPQCVYYGEYYYYKDETDDEYRILASRVDDIGEKQMWREFDEMKTKGEVHQNVREDIIAMKKKREDAKKRREKVLKHVTPFFVEEKPYLVVKAPIELLLANFISYWYGYTGCRGIINKNKVAIYVDSFLALDDIKILSDILLIIEAFEKKIREDGGVVEVS